MPAPPLATSLPPKVPPAMSAPAAAIGPSIGGSAAARLQWLQIPRERLHARGIKLAVQSRIGREILLNDARLCALASIQEYQMQTARNRHDRNFGFRVRPFNERLGAGTERTAA